MDSFDELGRDHAIALLEDVYRTLNSLLENSEQEANNYTDDTCGQMSYKAGYFKGGVSKVLEYMIDTTSETVNTLD